LSSQIPLPLQAIRGQSAGQVRDDSPEAQKPSPQTGRIGRILQSRIQELLVSEPLHIPSPQKGTQSAGQLKLFSPVLSLQKPSPQAGQSPGQESEDSQSLEVQFALQ